jgi:hypothetical protein
MSRIPENLEGPRKYKRNYVETIIITLFNEHSEVGVTAPKHVGFI